MPKLKSWLGLLLMVTAGCFWLFSLASCALFWTEHQIRLLGCVSVEFGGLHCFDGTWYGDVLTSFINFWWFGYILFGSAFHADLPPLLLPVCMLLLWGTGMLLAALIRRRAG